MEAEKAAKAPEPRPRGEQASNAFGLAVNDLPEARQKELKIRGGVEVDNADGPAARAGIRQGDLILRVGDVDIASAKQFDPVVKALDKTKPAAFFVRRGESTQVVVVRPAAAKAQ
ncbi:MAG: PDZ domain-containing protein [Candidatus Protistobacter heckmanni]|nr:PDZ domain-containing protein [Candidatus Protistobacter heckmanni]